MCRGGGVSGGWTWVSVCCTRSMSTDGLHHLNNKQIILNALVGEEIIMFEGHPFSATKQCYVFVT